MSYKVGTVLIELKADTAKVVKGVERVEKKFDKFHKDSVKSFDRVKSAILAIGAAWATVEATLRIKDIGMKFTATAATFEQFTSTLQTIEGSSLRAKDSMNWITDFAKTTPYNLGAVTEAFVKLKAYGIEPTDGTLRILGDTASAMGKPLMQGVEAIADAVTGENERLKEFGIRANVLGNKIKYSWTNASGEMRSTIVNNNSKIIQSTLESIFNSKYSGAMEQQSKTWNGLISNLEDQWTIFQKNIMDGGLFEYLKAIVMVVGDYLKDAFGKAGNSSKDTTLVVIEGIKGIIKSLGYAYDSLETFGDYWSVVKNLAKVAYYGIREITATLALKINETFENLLNSIIDGFNTIISLANDTGTVNIDLIGHYHLDDLNIARKVKREIDSGNTQAQADLKKSWDNLMKVGDGQKFADNFINRINETYKNLQDTTINTSGERTDFGSADSMLSNTKNSKDNKQSVKDKIFKPDLVATPVPLDVGKMPDVISNINDSFSNLQDTLQNGNDNNDVYTVTNNTNDSFKNLGDSSKHLYESISNLKNNMIQATSAVEKFVFAFSNKFLNSIKSNISALQSVYSTSTTNPNMSYQEALKKTREEQLSLIDNPLDVEAGNKYKEAYSQFTQSAQNYLSDMTHFSNKNDYEYAKATVSAQTNSFQTTAQNTVSVLDSMNNFLSAINNAFKDGILTDEEKATISGVADNVNAKNDILMGQSGSIYKAIYAQEYYNNKGLATDSNISAQEYYNNKGLATDSNISAQEYYNNTGLMLDKTFTDNGITALELDNAGLYKGEDIGTNVRNQITNYATSRDINSQEYYNNTGLATDSNISAQEYYNNKGLATETATNSVEIAIARLMGDAQKGITLSSIASTLPQLSVNTGLDVSDLANITSNTSAIQSAANATKSAVYNTSIKGSSAKTLDNLRLKSVTTTNHYRVYNGVWSDGSRHSGTDYSTITGTTTRYSYYKKGGYTGDISDDAIAGFVHGQEYVVNAKTTKDLGLNDGNGGVFKDMLAELRALRKKTDRLEKVNEAMAISMQEQANLTKRAAIEGSLV